MNKILLGDKWGLFLGEFENNIFHKHYAIQINIPLKSPIRVYDDTVEFSSTDATIIPSNVKHKIDAKHPFLLILINPLETIIKQKNISTFNHHGVQKIQKTSILYLENRINNEAFEKTIGTEISKIIGESVQIIDDRIVKALSYLRKNTDRIVSLQEIANHCYLSESRFLHLFKSEVKITYRRAQLWYRIIQSFNSLKTISITQTAYDFGFTDIAHYSKTFKENFGFSPKQFIINSQFIQV